MDNVRIKEMNGVSLAYLGDAVWELRVRELFIFKNFKVNQLNRLVKPHVNAVSQSKILLDILDTLDEENLSFVKRVKNSKISSYPKTCSPREYRNATAFEALIAKWYIEKKDEKIREILEKYVLKKEEKL